MKLKFLMNLLMMIGMFFSMSVQFGGMGMHKIIGLLTLILFIWHTVKNYRWFCGFFSQRCNHTKKIQMITHIMLILSMIGIMMSGIMLSKEIVHTVVVDNSMTVARMLHLVSSYLGCAGIALHVAFHLGRRKG